MFHFDDDIATEDLFALRDNLLLPVPECDDEDLTQGDFFDALCREIARRVLANS